MGDRTTAYLEISGDVTQDEARRIFLALVEEGAKTSDSWEEVTYETMGDRLAIEEANFGEIDAVTDVLKEIGVIYTQSWDSGYDFAAGGRHVDPLRKIEYAWSEIEGYVVFTDADFSRITQLHNTPAEQIAAIKEHFANAYPPLKPFNIIGGIPETPYIPENGRAATAEDFGICE